MNAAEILKRDAELRQIGTDKILHLDAQSNTLSLGISYLARIAEAERKLIETVRAWRDLTWTASEPRDVTTYIKQMCDAYDALLATMAEAQR